MIPDIVHPLCDSVVAHIMIRRDSVRESHHFTVIWFFTDSPSKCKQKSRDQNILIDFQGVKYYFCLPNLKKQLRSSSLTSNFSAIYGMLNKIIPTLKRHGFPTEKVDFLIAMGENLIQMKSSTDMQKLEGLTDASTNAKTDPAHNFESNSLEFTQHIRNIACNHLN